MMKRNKILAPLLFLMLAISPALKAQIDTVFWFAAPWVTPDHAQNKPMSFRISSFGQATTVRIQQPASTYDTTFTVNANSLFSKDLTHLHNLGLVETKPNNVVKQTGFKISSDFPITVVYDFLSSGNNPETYCLTGQNGMGYEFVTPFQTMWNNRTLTGDVNSDGITEQPYQSFTIVATDNNTTVWITPRCVVKGGHPANTTYSVSLNQGESFCVENAVQNTNVSGNNLGGSIVVSNKPVSVTVSDDSVNPAPAGCYDLMGEQIVPTDVIGKEYIINKGFIFRATPHPDVKDYVFLVATQNFTTITIEDRFTIKTQILNQGETFKDSIVDSLTHIIADKNIYVIHASGYGCELGEALIPPLNCSGSDQVNFTRTATAATASFFLNVLCRTGDEGSFTLNGSTTLLPATSFTVVPGTGGAWKGAQKQFTLAEIPLFTASSISNSTGLFSLGIIDGGPTGGCLYHYMSSFLRRVYTNAGIDQSLCSGLSDVSLSGSVTGGASTGIWTVLNGTGTLNNPTSFNTTYTPSSNDTVQGSVTFVLASTGNCVPVTDTVTINFNPNPTVFAGTDLIRCENNIGTISLSGTMSNAVGANWTGGNGGAFNNPGSLNTTYTPSPADIAADSLTLVLTTAGNISGCPDVEDSVKIYFTPAPFVDAGSNATVCANNAVINLSGIVGGSSTSGIWSTTGSGLITPNDTLLTGLTYSPSNSDTTLGVVIIKLTSTNNGLCNAVEDSITVTIIDAPSVDILSADTICANISSINLSSNVTTGFPIDWTTFGAGSFTSSSNPSTTYNISPLDTAQGQVTIVLTTQAGLCNSVSDTLHLTLADPPSVFAGNDISICSNEIVQLNGVVSGVTNVGIWTSTGTGTFNPSSSQLFTTYVPSSQDVGSTISLILTSQNNQGCNPDDDTLNVTFKQVPLANFSANEVCLTQNTTFTDLSVPPAGGSISSWFWDFGDLQTSTASSPLHTFIGSGSFVTTLITTASNGCKDTIFRYVTINVIPYPDFAFTTPCRGNATLFNDQSFISEGSIISWNYDYGDQTPNDTISNTSHVFVGTGFYPVTLTVVSDKGCSNSVAYNVNVLNQPTASFVMSSNPALAGESVTFNDASTGNPTSWSWNFGDETGTNLQNPAHIYSAGGYYTISLTAIDQNGCTDTISKEILIAMLPVLPTAFTPNGDNENDIFYVRGGPFKSILFKVYNNWGELLYQTDDQTQGWDGKYKNIDQAMGVYVWYVEVEVADGRIFKKSGDVTLIR